MVFDVLGINPLTINIKHTKEHITQQIEDNKPPTELLDFWCVVAVDELYVDEVISNFVPDGFTTGVFDGFTGLGELI